MRKLLLLVAVMGLFACTGQKENSYKIEGTVTGDSITDAKVYLQNFSRTNPVKDTADLVEGKFVFEGSIETPDTYAITIDGIKGRIMLFLENANYTIEAAKEDFSKAVVKGGVTNELVNALNAKKDSLSKTYNMGELFAEYENPATTPERRMVIDSLYEKMQKEMAAYDSLFYVNNPASPYTLIQYVRNLESFKIEDAEAKLASFKALPEFTSNTYVAELESDIATLKSLVPGMKAPEFTLNDPKGNQISLSSVYTQNKITMIDFWAGWCSPCRQFNPTLVKIYKELNKTGFGVIGVSLDKDAELWNKAIADDKLEWAQVSELKYWESEVAKKYHVRYIPQNIFVDQNGNIIRRQVSTDEILGFVKGYIDSLKSAEVKQ
ncbi:MAG: TlpA disulfide reductase family protein [Bacteroidales bacterium]|nr:TlpA disulfide reductase family protein [Bacteroidales bacterium]